MKTGVVMQPTYLPWIGYFDLIDRADVFVFYDDVQLVKQSWGTKNRIKTSNGEQYIIVPIKNHISKFENMYNTAITDERKPWRKKHLKSIFYAYQKSSFFKEVYAFVEPLILYSTETYADFTINIVKQISHRIGINTHFVRSSTLESTGKKDERLVKLCHELGISTYLSPQGASTYLNAKNQGGFFAFEDDIKLVYHNYAHPEYTQLYGDFMSHLSIIDLLFNYGFEQTLEVIHNGRQPHLDYDQL